MPTLTFNNRVVYFPGAIPCANAQVTIYDVDQGGNGTDKIFSGTTNSNGYFSGTSTNWQDTNTVRVPNPFGGPSSTMSIPDTLILMIQIKVDGKDTGQLPFTLPPAGVTAPPIILPFPPPTPSLTVNGQACSGGYDLQVKARAAFESGYPLLRYRFVDQTQRFSYLLLVTSTNFDNLLGMDAWSTEYAVS